MGPCGWSFVGSVSPYPGGAPICPFVPRTSKVLRVVSPVLKAEDEGERSRVPSSRERSLGTALPSNFPTDRGPTITLDMATTAINAARTANDRLQGLQSPRVGKQRRNFNAPLPFVTQIASDGNARHAPRWRKGVGLHQSRTSHFGV